MARAIGSGMLVWLNLKSVEEKYQEFQGEILSLTWWKDRKSGLNAAIYYYKVKSQISIVALVKSEDKANAMEGR